MFVLRKDAVFAHFSKIAHNLYLLETFIFFRCFAQLHGHLWSRVDGLIRVRTRNSGFKYINESQSSHEESAFKMGTTEVPAGGCATKIEIKSQKWLEFGLDSSCNSVASFCYWTGCCSYSMDFFKLFSKSLSYIFILIVNFLLIFIAKRQQIFCFQIHPVLLYCCFHILLFGQYF